MEVENGKIMENPFTLGDFQGFSTATFDWRVNLLCLRTTHPSRSTLGAEVTWNPGTGPICPGQLPKWMLPACHQPAGSELPHFPLMCCDRRCKHREWRMILAPSTSSHSINSQSSCHLIGLGPHLYMQVNSFVHVGLLLILINKVSPVYRWIYATFLRLFLFYSLTWPVQVNMSVLAPRPNPQPQPTTPLCAQMSQSVCVYIYINMYMCVCAQMSQEMV